jgi:2-C-methyl-D-erythritol 4-phosphate cytidylyltransferase
MNNTEVAAIVLAAGQGSRFKGRKQFLEFHGKPLYKHVYDTLSSVIPISNIIVVGVDIEGGSTRNESVKIGLQYLASINSFKKVVICEAARSLVTQSQIEQIILTESSSICYVNPVVDTVILKDKTYINREDCLHLVSPQAFDFQLLYDAYENADLSELRTDETRLMYEVYGIKPDFLIGEDNLYKVTYPKDIAVLESIYQIYYSK